MTESTDGQRAQKLDADGKPVKDADTVETDGQRAQDVEADGQRAQGDVSTDGQRAQ